MIHTTRRMSSHHLAPIWYVVMVCALLLSTRSAWAQVDAPQAQGQTAATTTDEAQAAEDERIVAEAVRQLLAMQEGDDKAEWPYEGVYRVGGRIPIGYRVGGTAIVGMSLLHAPGYADDAARQDAIARATVFIMKSVEHPFMTPDYDGGYDVRGWGYTYGLTFLLTLRSLKAQPQEMEARVDETIRVLIDAITQTEIPQIGGWNYARGQGKETVSPPAPFMTGPTLQALFEAKQQGFAVDAAVVSRALDTLENGRTPTGSYRYSGINGEQSRESVPGSVGRMLVAESTRYLAGRTSIADVRGALDAFLVHWQWLDKRRAQQGTHVPPYGIAPYYFYFAHYYAAQAIELLPRHERAEYRRRLRELILSVRLPDGTWNDRVFPRSANFGSAMSILAMMSSKSPAPARWEPNEELPLPTDATVPPAAN